MPDTFRVRLDDVHKSFPSARGELEVLRGVGLSLEAGDAMGFEQHVLQQETHGVPFRVCRSPMACSAQSRS